jgi:hypothetical protein
MAISGLGKIGISWDFHGILTDFGKGRFITSRKAIQFSPRPLQ